MRRLGWILAATLAAGGPLLAAAVDAPHDVASPQGPIDCMSCHVGHNSPAASMTKSDGNFNLCGSCHLDTERFGFAWNESDQATPGVGGRSHRWDAIATNFGATPPDPGSADPVEAALGAKLDAGKLKCSTCHDVHQADINRGNPNSNVALNTNLFKTGGGTGTLQLTSIPSNANAAAYKIKISAPNAFKISHDNGISYFGYNGSLTPKWNAEGVAGYSNGKPFTSGTPVTLDDEATTVTFTGTFDAVTPDIFQNFYVSFPFLRADNTDSRMCVTCHRDRNMNHVDVEGGVANGLSGGRLTSVTLGTTVFSHPVGEGVFLNANNRGYDRNITGPLDADGSLQSSGTDPNPSNDLRLGTGGIVHCMTCHHPHNADSNSITPDPR